MLSGVTMQHYVQPTATKSKKHFLSGIKAELYSLPIPSISGLTKSGGIRKPAVKQGGANKSRC